MFGFLKKKILSEPLNLITLSIPLLSNVHFINE